MSKTATRKGAAKRKPSNDLTDRQALFVSYYLGEALGNATEAAKLAGYEAKDRSVHAAIGSENLRKPKIRAIIDERLDELAMGTDEILARLSEHARGNMARFIETRTYGMPVISFEKETLEKYGHLIKKYSVGRQKVSIELHDPQAALVHLGKYRRLWVDRTEVTGADGGPLVTFTSDDLAKAREAATEFEKNMLGQRSGDTQA